MDRAGLAWLPVEVWRATWSGLSKIYDSRRCGGDSQMGGVEVPGIHYGVLIGLPTA